MTSIPTKIGMALIMVYWLSMAGMVANAYFHYNYDVSSVNSNEV
jgi:hypothetical protein